jgi:CRISPR-associated Cas5-like protein
VRAPFARFGTFTDGYHVPTHPSWTPTAALGLIGALLGLDINRGDTLPAARIALGIPKGSVSEIGVLLHQWHNYPKDGGKAETADGNRQLQKPKIAPNRVEYVCNSDTVIAVQGVDIDALRAGVEFGPPLYAGASELLIDHLDWQETPGETRWWQPLASEQRLVRGLARMRSTIHRQDSSKSRSLTLQLRQETSPTPPADAWMQPEIHP